MKFIVIHNKALRHNIIVSRVDDIVISGVDIFSIN